MNGKWMPIIDFPGYQISNYGEIRRGEKILLKQLNHNGYYKIGLFKGGRFYRRFVHRLVLLTFIGPPPEGHETSHLDGDRTNNNLTNLAWESKAANMFRKRLHGTIVQGEKTPQSRLTADIVSYVREKYLAGESCPSIAKKLNVHSDTVWMAATRRTWKHIFP